MPHFYVQTFGCQMNAHDSERMEEVLMGSGYQPTTGAAQSDVVVLNTCSIREKAEQKLRSEVGRLGRLKKKRPELVIAVAGCVAQQEGQRLLKSLPQIDLIIGPDNIPELPDLLAQLQTGGLPQVRTVFDVEDPAFLAAAPQLGRVGTCAYVTVMKGCNERCSYCIVPTTRGPERYRSSREIVDECQRLVAAGVREITLLGQTVNSYIDPSGSLEKAPCSGENRWQHTRGARAHQDETEFPALLRALAERVPGLLRLRYTSPHPRHLTSSLIEAHRDLSVLALHVHMPVQSGSDAQLRRMIRRYSAAEYIERTDALRDAVPGLTLSSDVIVGFCGETEKDFECTLDLVERVGFVALYGFIYSQRPGTPALRLQDDVPPARKSERLHRLFELVDRQKSAHLSSLVGTRQQVLVDGYGKTGDLSGRTLRNEIVHLPQLSLADGGSQSTIAGSTAADLALPEEQAEGLSPGALVEVDIREAFRNSLSGSVTNILSAAPQTTAASPPTSWQASPAPSPTQGRSPRRLPMLS